MEKKSTLYNIYNDLVNAIKPIVSNKYIFLKDRPNTVDGGTPMEKFVVVDLPVSIEDIVAGTKKTLLSTSGVFYVFTQAKKNGTLDIGATGDLVDNIVGLFPIVGEYVSATSPVVRMTGSDGMGFQVTTITFDLLSKWNVFSDNKG